MILSPEQTEKIQSFIKSIYSEDLNDSFLNRQADTICELMDSHYFAAIMFPNKFSKDMHFFSNNPDEFSELYLNIQDKDVLIDTLINHNAPVFYKEVNQMDIPGKDDFFEPLQQMRPVSDCCYIPIRIQGRLCGFSAIARAGLKSKVYDQNDLEVFQFLSRFLNEGFIRTLKLPAPEGNQAYLNTNGAVLNAGPAIKEALIALFGEKYWDSPVKGLLERSILFDHFLKQFSGNMHTPGNGTLKLQNDQQEYYLEFKWIQTPAYRPVYADEAQFEIRLKQSLTENGPVILDLEKAQRDFQLTKREIEVIDCIYKGLNNKRIAESMHISESTVKKHLWNIYNKVGVNSRTKLIFALS